ncbi:MAG TPA: DUF998 domain-containing protein [Streptosporangiaceae bacterium]|nr:DUF998 domain-containing protein [Streptosporangiaceae bacterium]
MAGRRLPVLGGLAGLAGPAVFTAAWAVSSLLQTGHAATEVQISGLAAPDARDPWIMISGFLVLGCSSVVFGTALDRELGGSGREGRAGRAGRAGPEGRAGRAGWADLGPRLIQAAGLLTVAAGLLRRDRMLLTAPAHESWHNHAHDVVSALIYVALMAAPLLLARRFRGDPWWGPLRWPLVSASLATAAVLVVFFTGAFPSWAGLLQRIGVSVPLAAVCAVAARLLAAGGEPQPAGERRR